jgi:SAM-dependent methyltransferase
MATHIPVNGGAAEHGAAEDALQRQLSGRELFGDSFSPAQIAQWREQTDEFHRAHPHQAYQYGTLDRFHLLGGLLDGHYAQCVALGCADAEELRPLAPVVDQFIALEPLERLWRSEIAGKPIRYGKPSVNGNMAIESSSVDLVVALDVLHHIANVSHLLAEIARVLKPGGLLAVREPISSMGDWREARPGMTPYERGLPVAWFKSAAQARGLHIVRERLCLFAPLSKVLMRLNVRPPLKHRPLVLLDWLLSESLRWNVRYRRSGALSKLAPSSAAWLLRKSA